jgi:3alpha(or 20beta)-hydroxysteroid dehydrogenase
VVGDVRDEQGRAVVNRIGSAALYQHLDVTWEDEWAEAVAAAERAFGRLDVLVSDAGIRDGAPLAEMTLASWRRLTEVNQTGVFLGMRAAVAGHPPPGLE